MLVQLAPGAQPWEPVAHSSRSSSQAPPAQPASQAVPLRLTPPTVQLTVPGAQCPTAQTWAQSAPQKPVAQAQV